MSAFACLFVGLNLDLHVVSPATCSLLFASPETHAEYSALRVNFVSCSDELEPVIFVALLNLGWSTDILKRGDSLIRSHQLEFWEGGSCYDVRHMQQGLGWALGPR